MRLVIFAVSAERQRPPFGLLWRSVAAFVLLVGGSRQTLAGHNLSSLLETFFQMNSNKCITELSASFYRGGAVVCMCVRVSVCTLKVRMKPLEQQL